MAREQTLLFYSNRGRKLQTWSAMLNYYHNTKIDYTEKYTFFFLCNSITKNFQKYKVLV